MEQGILSEVISYSGSREFPLFLCNLKVYYSIPDGYMLVRSLGQYSPYWFKILFHFCL